MKNFPLTTTLTLKILFVPKAAACNGKMCEHVNDRRGMTNLIGSVKTFLDGSID